MIDEELVRVNVFLAHWKDAIVGRIIKYEPAKNDIKSYVATLQWKEFKGLDQIEPTFSFQKAQAQELMDDLWRCGIRPSEVGTAGQLASVQEHLKDMKRIAFGLMKKHGVE